MGKEEDGIAAGAYDCEILEEVNAYEAEIYEEVHESDETDQLDVSGATSDFAWSLVSTSSKEAVQPSDSPDVSPISPLRKCSKVLFNDSVEVSLVPTEDCVPVESTTRTFRDNAEHVRPFGGRKTCAGFSLGGTLTLDPSSGIADSKIMRKRRHLS
jgi:hypothetical protein